MFEWDLRIRFQVTHGRNVSGGSPLQTSLAALAATRLKLEDVNVTLRTSYVCQVLEQILLKL